MKSLTFLQGANAVIISAATVYGTDWWDDRLNQFELPTANGTDVVYDNGPIMCHGMLVMKGVSYTDGNNLRTWLKTYAIYALNTFSISQLANTDLGKGKNTALTVVRWDGGQSTSGVFNLVAPGNYDINFPYRFLRS